MRRLPLAGPLHLYFERYTKTMPESGPKIDKHANWEAYVEKITELREKAKETYFTKQKHSRPELTKELADREIFQAFQVFALSLREDIQTEKEMENPNASPLAAHLKLGKKVAWHTLIGSTLWGKKENPGRDINKRQIEQFFRKILATGEIPEPRDTEIFG